MIHNLTNGRVKIMKLSLIIPVYQVENYLRKCLDSCLNQDISKETYEIICVNDGSKDRSADILTEYKNKYSNVIVITQLNQGLSVTRNNGLKIARGEYVWFIDSDDTILPNSIKGIINCLKTNSPDMLQLNYNKVFEDGRPVIPCYCDIKGQYSGIELQKIGRLPVPAQFTIYNRLFLEKNKLCFLPGILHEDIEFKPRVTYLANTICFYEPIVYNYLQRVSGSITSSFKFRNAHDIIVGINSLIKFSRDIIKNEIDKGYFRKNIGLNLNTLLDGMKKMDTQDRALTIAMLKENKHIFKEMVHSKNLLYIFEGLFLNLNLNFSLKLYSLIS